MSSETKICQNCKKEFVIEPEDFAFYEKIKVPAPSFCPDCRTIRRMTFRNERTLYKRICDATKKEIISMYSSEKPFRIYGQKYWWTDNWDPLDYGSPYDFSKTFFEQFKSLYRRFPLMSVSNQDAVNSDYCNMASESKDCYLISATLKNEKVLYSNRITFDKDSSDLYVVHKSEFCYDDVSCFGCYRVFFSKDCQNCQDSYFLYDCRNCQNCFCCVNLRNRNYCIFNKPYTREEYQKKIKEFDLGSFENIIKFKNYYKNLYLKSLHRFAHIVKSVNVVGDNIDNTKNCYYCFDVTQNAEDCKFCIWAGASLKDAYDSGVGVGNVGELIYEAFDTGMQGSRLYFTGTVHSSHNVQYALACFNSSYLFGCIGLRNKQYCILNKQYSKEEYEKLVPRIIEHMNTMPYISRKSQIPNPKSQINSNNQNSKSKTREIVYRYGEFFPSELSPFCYNETIAQEYFPLTKEQAIEQGYSWKDPEERNYKIQITNDKLPDNIKDVNDSIVGQVIECFHKGQCNEQCTEAFKIIEPELAFYRRMSIPLPRLCPNCRHYQRLKQRNPLKLWKRQCQCGGMSSVNGVYQNTGKREHGASPCLNTFETSYAPDRPEIVYCEQCYLAEVV